MTSSRATKPAPRCTIVLFGAAGDLVKRLLMPAIYDLATAGLLDRKTHIIGVDRAELTDESWRSRLGKSLKELASDPTAEFNAGKIKRKVWDDIAGRLSFMQGDVTKQETFAALAEELDGNAIFYCAVASHFVLPIAEGLAKAGLLKERGKRFRRLIVEKPFGNDLRSAKALDRRLLALASEDQIYRIDHFLGKDTVQSILPLRFANRIFEPVWSAEHIDHVQITAAETIGVEGRGSFYEQAGALRDMVPNHLFQLLAMTAMEPPADLGQKAVRDAKAALIEAVKPVRPEDAVRGQYAAGRIGGRRVPAYRDEPGVAHDSAIETYAAMKLVVDTPRWRGVPFYLRSGKRMTAHRTEVVLAFKPSATSLFGSGAEAPAPNRLFIHIDGDKGLRTEFQTRQPGPALRAAGVAQSFRHDDFFVDQPNVGYETLLHACMAGDATLFQRADSIEAAWAAVEPALDAWGKGRPEPYASGSAGPEAADALLARAGHGWTSLEPPKAPKADKEKRGKARS